MPTPSIKIYQDQSMIKDAGRGVFATQDLKKDEVIERCPVIVSPDKDLPHLRQTELYNYYFMWGEGNDQAAVCLGYGSLYNHSYSPNATYKKHFAEQVIDFVAIKDIAKGEEITVNYNYGNPDDQSPLWIKSIKPPQ